MAKEPNEILDGIASPHEIGKRLRKFRRYKRMKQTAFCRPLGLLPNMWSEYEAGNRRLPLNAALLLRQRHNLPLDWIYLGEEDGLPKRLVDALAQLEDGEDLSSR